MCLASFAGSASRRRPERVKLLPLLFVTQIEEELGAFRGPRDRFPAWAESQIERSIKLPNLLEVPPRRRGSEIEGLPNSIEMN